MLIIIKNQKKCKLNLITTFTNYHNYAVDNAFGVEIFETNRNILVKVLLDKEVIEDLKTCLQTHKEVQENEDRSLHPKSKTLNNCILLLGIGIIKLTKREMIKQVDLKGIPATQNLDLKRANDHNCTALTELQKVLEPIEEADEIKTNFAKSGKTICGNNRD